MSLSASELFYYALRPSQFYAIIKWKTSKRPVHHVSDRPEDKDLKECYRLLDLTSRSFAMVTRELPPELLDPVCIFYLTLRGLDTIEDDMTIAFSEKEPLLRQFHTFLEDVNWTYDGNDPKEKDREVLVNFDSVTREFQKFKPAYQHIIKDITEQMGNGMADYAQKPNSVKTVHDYELYCHYVAGLVGDGLTRLFVEAKFADEGLLKQTELTESMSQLLQQTNIIRDIREDHVDERRFWPEEVWTKYANDFGDLMLPRNREKALQCSSEMVLMAINRVDECLQYMSRIKQQGVFNFVAIPQTMAIATLELCFQNPAIFERNIKITKGTSCQIMLESTKDIKSVAQVFKGYALKIKAKNNRQDPHFGAIKAACEKIERTADRLAGVPPRRIEGDLEDPAVDPFHWAVALVVTGAIAATIVYITRQIPSV